MPKKYHKKSKKYSKKKYSVSTGRLKSRKIDSLIEKRMESIAKKEARKSNPSLCLRRYCWVDYNPFTNEFSRLTTSISDGFNWSGQMINLTEKIIKEDIATVTNIAIPDDPNTQLREDVDRALDGANILTTMKVAHGRRTGDEIYLTGWSLNNRITCDFTPDDPADPEQFYDKIDVHFGLIKIRRTYSTLGVPVVYTPKQLLKLNPWGYHPALDVAQARDDTVPGVRVLFRDKVTISNSSSMHPNIVFVNKKGYFKNPIKISYEDRDINAISAIHDVYLVIRSTVASSGNAQDAQSEPFVETCAKLYYINNK